MTNEKYVELIIKIQEYCISARDCPKCKFRVTIDGERHCQFKALARALTAHPCNWNIKELEKIVKL